MHVSIKHSEIFFDSLYYILRLLFLSILKCGIHMMARERITKQSPFQVNVIIFSFIFQQSVTIIRFCQSFFVQDSSAASN
jgi:hypothetical protein